MVPEVVVEFVFGGSQAREFGIEGCAFPDPKLLMSEQRVAVHQQRLHVREQHPQTVQDVEAVGIDVAPVVQRALVQPAHFGQAVEAVAQTEYHQATGHVGKGQAVDLVLRDEHPLRGQVEAGEFARRNGEVRQALYGEALVQDAEADLRRFGGQAVALLEVAIVILRVEHDVEQLRKQRFAGFDELGVDAGDIELAQVEPAARVAGPLLLAVVFVSALLVFKISQTFQDRLKFLQAFTTVANGFSPMFLFHFLDASATMYPAVPWLLGMALPMWILYQGIPRIMQPDPTHAFGVYLSAMIVVVLTSGLARLMTGMYLLGYMDLEHSWVSNRLAHLLGH